MTALLAEYQWAFEVSPQSDLVSLFTLKYTYHNLKVYPKHKATEREVRALIDPLSVLILSMCSSIWWRPFLRSIVRLFMAEEVAATWQEFQDYQDLRVLEIGMDLAYFKHLRYIGDSLDHPILKQLVGRDH